MDATDDAPEGPTWGCLIFPGIFLAVGIAVIAAGFMWPDVASYNAQTGQRQAFGDTGPIVGGVFTGIGVIGCALWAYIEIATWRQRKAD